jgi:hypothetical protein
MLAAPLTCMKFLTPYLAPAGGDLDGKHEK